MKKRMPKKYIKNRMEWAHAQQLGNTNDDVGPNWLN